jgi:uncharacterized protein (DUF1697 family)
MTRSIALLRGINVGASGRIRMDTLKRLLEDAGLRNVETYIQSGNVLFDTGLSERDARETIVRALKERAQIATVAVLRSAQELSFLIENCPFTEREREDALRANTEAEGFYVLLLPEPPVKEKLEALASMPLGGDAFAVAGRDIYLLLRQGIRLSRFAIRLQKSFPDATVRNWNTLSALNELCLTRKSEDPS